MNSEFGTAKSVTKLYGIRHKLTKELMFLTKRNRGYTLWDGTKNEYCLDIPRFFTSLSSAMRTVREWVKGPYTYTESDFYQWELILTRMPSNRTKDDLEIVEFLVIEASDDPSITDENTHL